MKGQFIEDMERIQEKDEPETSTRPTQTKLRKGGKEVRINVYNGKSVTSDSAYHCNAPTKTLGSETAVLRNRHPYSYYYSF